MKSLQFVVKILKKAVPTILAKIELHIDAQNFKA